MATNPEFNKNAGCPYSNLANYYKKPAASQNGSKQQTQFGIPEFGSVGYNADIAKAAAASTCHTWREGSYDGRVLANMAYPQCSPNADCAAYSSRY